MVARVLNDFGIITLGREWNRCCLDWVIEYIISHDQVNEAGASLRGIVRTMDYYYYGTVRYCFLQRRVLCTGGITLYVCSRAFGRCTGIGKLENGWCIGILESLERIILTGVAFPRRF